MAVEVIMPALGMTQETGTLIEWLKSEGDAVKKGEPLMVVETDKTAVEIESPGEGILRNVNAKPGDEFPVGSQIAVLVADGEAVPEAASAQTPGPQTQKAEIHVEQPTSAPAATPLARSIAESENIDLHKVASSGAKISKADVLGYQNQADEHSLILASPKARRLAKQASVSLESIVGTGPQGVIVASDVPPANATRSPQTGRVWQIMAKRLTESWQTVPHFYLTYDARLAGLNDWYRSLKNKPDSKVTITDLLTKIIGHALILHPQINASWRNGAIEFNDKVNIGLAVAVDAGLVVPVIHRANKQSVLDITNRRRQLVAQAREGTLTPDDVANGTFTISNLGMFGVREFSAIVNPPQAAILAVGMAEDRVVPANGQVVVQNQMTLTLSCDHRVIDGVTGARFMQTLISLLESPAQLID